MNCRTFSDILSRRSEHLDDEIIRSLHPYDTWIGHVSTGRFPAESGVEHTFDRFEQVFPNLCACWTAKTATTCVGTPCDPTETKIGFGFTRDSYALYGKSYSTDLFCYDLIMSADRAKQQFAHIIRMLRRASNIISSHRLRTEGFRIATRKWICLNGLTAMTTATWNADCTELTVNAAPASKLTRRHLQRRVIPQIHLGALGEDLNKGTQPMLEFVTDPETLEELKESNDVIAHWQWTDFSQTKDYRRLGWNGQLGNFGVRCDSMPLRFNLKQQNADGSYTFQLVFPYENVAATEGIKESLNDDYENAHYQLSAIWHRMAMRVLVQDTTQINPEMPFAARDFAGKWFFAQDNLTCGTDVNGNPIAVDNSRRNKGMFKADFANATQAQYPELAEWFFHLREPACIVDVPVCSADPGYPTQTCSSANDECPE